MYNLKVFFRWAALPQVTLQVTNLGGRAAPGYPTGDKPLVCMLQMSSSEEHLQEGAISRRVSIANCNLMKKYGTLGNVIDKAEQLLRTHRIHLL